MRWRRHRCLTATARSRLAAGLLAASLLACSGGLDLDGGLIAIDGSVQKGPASADTTVQVQALDAALAPLGAPARATVAALGRYAARVEPRGSYVEVTSSGRFFDEVAAADAAAPITLRAVVPIDTASATASANVNLLTTLVAARARAMLQADPRRSDALTAAEAEVNALFPFAPQTPVPGAFHRLDLLGAGPANAYALLSSLVLLQAIHDSGAAADTWLEALATDFADNGVLDDAGRAASLQAARDHLDVGRAVDALRSFCAGQGLAVDLADVGVLANRPPVADAGAPTVVIVGETVQLDAGASHDPDGGPLAYRWDLRRNQNDGPWDHTPLETFTLEGVTASFKPPKTASYDITLTVTDAHGLSAVATTTAIARHTFRDNGDGTVTNLQTGLMWQQRDDGNLYMMAEATGRSYLGIRDENHGLHVCADLVLAGHDDWRTPRLREVESQRDFTFAPPRIDHEAFPDTHLSAYIADAWAPNTQANFVEFVDGMVLRTSMGGRWPLRCVR